MTPETIRDAAPDLLKALERIAAMTDSEFAMHHARLIAKAALDKARGQI